MICTPRASNFWGAYYMSVLFLPMFSSKSLLYLAIMKKMCYNVSNKIKFFCQEDIKNELCRGIIKKAL